jgi:ADP-ribose pyrophosphatase YjhB (NUDIX family)/GNAT superfamily N-acetyltransferase
MPIPDFVRDLRRRVGTELLWMPGVTAVVRNDRGEVLLGRRADNGFWALVSGILEPGEQPAVGLVREIREETGVEARVTALAAVWSTPEATYPNGDRARYLDLCFLAQHVSGEPHVADDESTEVGWYPVDSLPEPFSPTSRRKLESALAFTGHTAYVTDAGEDGAPAPVPGAAGSPALAELGGGVVLRRARPDDLAAVVGLLADDRLGATREDESDLTAYRRGFDAIEADPNQLLVVLDDGQRVVGTLQLSFLPGISHGGSWRSQVEGVRVAADLRGSGLGGAMMGWVVEESRRRGCRMVQLTTNKQRADAHRFYAGLGFRASHEGFKLDLAAAPDLRADGA